MFTYTTGTGSRLSLAASERDQLDPTHSGVISLMGVEYRLHPVTLDHPAPRMVPCYCDSAYHPQGHPAN